MGFIPRISIDLDKERQFALSFGTLWRFQNKTGKTLEQLFQALARVRSGESEPSEEIEVTGMIGALVWAGLVEDDESLTLEQVMNMLPFNPVEALTQVFNAISENTGDTDGSAPLEGNAQNLSAMDGEDSGPSGDTS